MTSVLHNARSDVLKRAGQWENLLVCACSSFCLFLCDKAPPKIRGWCTQTQRQSALKILCDSQRVKERKYSISVLYMGTEAQSYYALLEVIQEVCGRAKNWTEIRHNRKPGLPLSAVGFVLLVMWAELAPSISLPVLSIPVFPVWACFSSET